MPRVPARARLALPLVPVLLALAAAPPGHARDAIRTPQVGDPDRKAILNALRPAVEAALGGRVLFVVNVLRTDGRWAFFQGTPQRPGGRAVDWTRTPYAEAWRADAMSDVVMGLVARTPDGWRLVDHVIGPTDVHWVGWRDAYGLPQRLFLPE
ncbi:hypothetical protein [Roseospira navarrensis]|uniref:Uncharacterized protein n=1 Tax=Roseospira navarrensis TaxID=140058 RepID=A0A7X1ZCI3_9PROT|nr:hypothetical protein [Roseospira navarrensis]MQX35808.1 hypothetical protein [Roseospira navarrensis]